MIAGLPSLEDPASAFFQTETAGEAQADLEGMLGGDEEEDGSGGQAWGPAGGQGQSQVGQQRTRVLMRGCEAGGVRWRAGGCAAGRWLRPGCMRLLRGGGPSRPAAPPAYPPPLQAA